MRALVKWAMKYQKNRTLWQKFYYSDFFDLLHKVITWFSVQYQTLERMLFWGWKMRHSYDFDAHTVYEAIHLKLERIHKCMKENGHLEWNSDESNNLMRKLAECKGIAKKLAEENYRRHCTTFHETYRTKRQTSSWLDEAMERHYPKARVIDEKTYSHFFKKAIEADNLEKNADKKRLYYLLDKYLEQWWD